MSLNNNFEMATERARAMRKTFPHAIAARYDHASRRVMIDLNSKLTIGFSPRDVQGLEHANPSQLEEIEISPSGFGIHFPKVDADVYLPGLLEGFLGSKQWMASRLGELGGQSRSRAKKAASRANGRLGGRPRKRAKTASG
jgi:hypothetical protein